nr:MAG TPA: hypothetical protein [Caudoviricetes sp.]
MGDMQRCFASRREKYQIPSYNHLEPHRATISFSEANYTFSP